MLTLLAAVLSGAVQIDTVHCVMIGGPEWGPLMWQYSGFILHTLFPLVCL